jgi:hypothetical protein
MFPKNVSVTGHQASSPSMSGRRISVSNGKCGEVCKIVTSEKSELCLKPE